MERIRRMTQSSKPSEGAADQAASAERTVVTAVTPATFTIGDVVRHRLFPFRGVIFDVDPVFNNSEEWWESIPEQVRPRKDQPFYHLLAENDESSYVAYVSQQNLILEPDGEPVQHPAVQQMFSGLEGGRYKLRPEIRN
jgi:heat shock protein HspQ